MSVNGITTGMMAADYTPSAKAQKPVAETGTAVEDKGVVYEPSNEAKDSANNKITDYAAVVTKMKKELSAKNEHLQDLVNQLLSKQAVKYTSLAEMYRNLEVDPATQEQAAEEVSEDGYWGVEQTSDRLVAMAQALSGGDSSKADELIAAVKKGFDEATEAWGEELPDICRKTIDTAVNKLEQWRDGTQTEAIE